MGLGAVGKHAPDLTRAAASRFEHDVAAIRRPAGAFVATRVARDLDNFAGGSFHHVDVVVAVGPAPTEGKNLSVRRPCGIDDIAHVGQIEFGDARAVGIHGIKLRDAATIADEYDGLSSFRIPGGGSVGAVGIGKTPGAAAVGVGDVEFRIALHGGGKNNL